MTVKPYIPVTGIKIIPDKTETDNGCLGKIKVEIIPSDASVQDFSWHVSKDEVMRVDPKGRYVAKKPACRNHYCYNKGRKLSRFLRYNCFTGKGKRCNDSERSEIDVNEVYHLGMEHNSGKCNKQRGNMEKR